MPIMGLIDTLLFSSFLKKLIHDVGQHMKIERTCWQKKVVGNFYDRSDEVLQQQKHRYEYQ